MKKEREKLEEALNLLLESYSNDNKVIDRFVEDLVGGHNFSRGRSIGIFTKHTPLSFFNNIELCLIIIYFYAITKEYKIKPEDWFNEGEILEAESFRYVDEEKITRIVLHNVDQINEYQWICTKETYQNIARFMGNGLISYNMRTQRQPIVRRHGNKIIKTANIKPAKVEAIKKEMLAGTFNANVITWNIRKATGLERFKYNSKDRTLTIEVDENTNVDVIDGANRTAGFLKAVEVKPDINGVTLVMVYYVDEEKARQIIHQEAKAEPLDEEFVSTFDISDVNMQVVKNINSTQSMNEMFGRIGTAKEINSENKLVTFETLSKTIDYIYNLKDKPIIEARSVEKFLIQLFNIVVGIHYSDFNENLKEFRRVSYRADNNMFVAYIAFGEELKNKYPNDWDSKLPELLRNLDLNKPSDLWKEVGLENNINLSTVKKISKYFKKQVEELIV